MGKSFAHVRKACWGKSFTSVFSNPSNDRALNGVTKEDSMKNSDVIEKWSNGLPARGSNLSSDGDSLFSYSLKIGSHSDQIIYNYMSSGGGTFRSMTTSQHVSKAKSITNFKVVNP